MEETKNYLSKFFLNEKYKKIIIILGLVGIGLIFVSNLISNNKKETKIEKTSDLTVEEYRTNIENNLRNMVSSINGAGKSRVLVTLENSAETIYATEQKKNKESTEDKANGETTKKKESDDSETRYITIKDSNGTEKALSVTQVQPKVKGVVIVCDGGDNPDIQERVVNTVTTALNITSKRVCVTK